MLESYESLVEDTNGIGGISIKAKAEVWYG